MLPVLVIVFLILLYFYSTKNHDYWAKRGVKHDKPLPFFGNHLRNVLVKQVMTGVGAELYNKYPTEKIVGYYRGRTPELIIRDPEIIKRILITDFSYFYVRGGTENPEKEPLINNLFFMGGGRWKILRQHMSVSFSTGRIKGMFPLILKLAERLQEIAAMTTQKGCEIKAYDLMAEYTFACLASCGLGLDLDGNSIEYSNFFNVALSFFKKSNWQMFHIALEELYPEWKMLHTAKFIEDSFTSAIIEITRKVRENRGSKPSDRNDFMDTLLELGMKGQITMDSPYEQNEDGTPVEIKLEMDLNCIAAQVFLLLVAGYGTTATSTSFVLHQLAFKPDLQVKIQEEIDIVMANHDGNLTYSAIGELKLLEMAFMEALRILPPSGLIRRLCMKKYTIPGTDVTIDPGVKILIPLLGLHMDTKVFDNPTEFRPERFAPEAQMNHKYTYMPFGEGPRACIGKKLAYMQSLTGLAMILHKYSVIPAPSSKQQHVVKPIFFLIPVVEDGLPIILKPRTQ